MYYPGLDSLEGSGRRRFRAPNEVTESRRSGAQEAKAAAKAAKDTPMESSDDRPAKRSQMMPSKGPIGSSGGEQAVPPA